MSNGKNLISKPCRTNEQSGGKATKKVYKQLLEIDKQPCRIKQQHVKACKKQSFSSAHITLERVLIVSFLGDLPRSWLARGALKEMPERIFRQVGRRPKRMRYSVREEYQQQLARRLAHGLLWHTAF